MVIGGTATVEYGGVVQGDICGHRREPTVGRRRLQATRSSSAAQPRSGDRATVASDLITLGGSLHHETGAHIGGDIITNLPLPAVELPRVGSRARGAGTARTEGAL